MQPDKYEDIEFETSHDDLGKRLDRVLATHVHGISRARIQLLIRNELVTLDGEPAKPSTQVRSGQRIVATAVSDDCQKVPGSRSLWMLVDDLLANGPGFE